MDKRALDLYKEIRKNVQQQEQDTASGRYMLRSYILNSANKDCRILLGINTSNLCLLCFVHVNHRMHNLPKWHGISLQYMTLNTYRPKEQFLILEQTEEGAKNIYLYIIDDFISHLHNLSADADVDHAVAHLLYKWKHFFEESSDKLLNSQAQQGLFGELLFLQECLHEIGPSAVDAWVGCEKDIHDFRFGIHECEIKTTTTQPPYFVQISNEYQLDDEEIEGCLFLRVYVVRSSSDSVEDSTTLMDLIQNIRQMLVKEPKQFEAFNRKLEIAGFFDEDFEHYKTFYDVTDMSVFEVGPEFPKITSKSLSRGIVDLSYKLDLDMCQPFARTMSSVFLSLKG